MRPHEYRPCLAVFQDVMDRLLDLRKHVDSMQLWPRNDRMKQRLDDTLNVVLDDKKNKGRAMGRRFAQTTGPQAMILQPLRNSNQN